MGRMHFQHWKMVPDVKIVAICDANPNIKEDTKKAVGNIQGAEGQIDLDGHRAVPRPRGDDRQGQAGRHLPDASHVSARGVLGEGPVPGGPRAVREADGPDRGRLRPHDPGGPQERQGPPDRPLRAVLARVRQGQGDRRQRQVRPGRGGDVPAARRGARLERGQLVPRREPQRRRRARPAHPRHGLRAVPLRHAQGRVQSRGQDAGRAVDPHGHHLRLRRRPADHRRGRVGHDDARSASR